MTEITPFDLITTEELISILCKRWDAKEVAYGIIYGTDNQEEFEIYHCFSPDQIQDITDVFLDEAELLLSEEGLYDESEEDAY